MRVELAVPDGFCCRRLDRLHALRGALSGAGFANDGLTYRAINVLLA